MVVPPYDIQLRFYAPSRKGKTERVKMPSNVKRAGIRRRNPYHTRHTFACWLLTAGANPAFIASQMGHETAQMVYEIYGMWIDDMNDEQIAMLNARLS